MSDASIGSVDCHRDHPFSWNLCCSTTYAGVLCQLLAMVHAGVLGNCRFALGTNAVLRWLGTVVFVR